MGTILVPFRKSFKRMTINSYYSIEVDLSELPGVVGIEYGQLEVAHAGSTGTMYSENVGVKAWVATHPFTNVAGRGWVEGDGIGDVLLAPVAGSVLSYDYFLSLRQPIVAGILAKTYGGVELERKVKRWGGLWTLETVYVNLTTTGTAALGTVQTAAGYLAVSVRDEE